MNFKTVLLALATASGPLTAWPATASTQPAAPAETPALDVEVFADVFFNPTGLWMRGRQVVHIEASGVVDISTLNGGYKIDPDGVIQETPPRDSGAFQFFRDNGVPIGADPVAGTKKLFFPVFAPGHAQGVPYGALAAGFSKNPEPTDLSDFPDGQNSHGFSLVGSNSNIRAPRGGGYLFLAVNDALNTSGDNAGRFLAHVAPVPEPTAAALFLAGALVLAGMGRRRRR